MNVAYNMDCMEAMRQMPDKAFDLAVVDPPYGINITGRHRSQVCHVERERERAEFHLSAEAGDRSEEKVNLYGAASSKLTSQRFIMRSMTAPHRTRSISGSCGV